MRSFSFLFTGRAFTLFRFLFLLMLLSFPVQSQTKTNLDAVNILIDSSVTEISSKIIAEKVRLNLTLPEEYSSLTNHILYSLVKNNLSPFMEEDSLGKPYVSELHYTVSNVSVEYSEMHRSGLLGSYLVERKISLKGNYLLYNPHKEPAADDFNYTFSDTVKVDEIKNIENSSLSFTRSELPPEPFFSSILEPAVAIGAAAAAIILFFTLRSQ